MRSALAQQVGELVALLREGRVAAVIDRAAHMLPADVADVLLQLDREERRLLLTELPPRLAAHALLAVPRDAGAEQWLIGVGIAHAAVLLSELDDDDAGGLLSRMPAIERQAIVETLPNSAALIRLLSHGSRSVGALMTSRVVVVSESDTIALAGEAVRRQAADTGDLHEIFVVDAERRLRGVLSIQQLLLARPDSLVRDVMSRSTVHVGPDEERQLVARVVARYGLTSVPVLDAGGRLVGKVAAGDLRNVTVDEAANDLLRFGGVTLDAAANANWPTAVRSRLPWLYANLLPAFGAAAVVFFFKGTLARIVTLAVWLPVVAGVGGNAGTQALAIAIRKLARQPRQRGQLRTLIFREAVIGLANGLALGMVVAGVAVLAGESWKVGLVVCLALIGNLTLAGIAGAALPVFLRRSGRDPAIGSPVVIPALMDAAGFALLLGLASVMLL